MDAFGWDGEQASVNSHGFDAEKGNVPCYIVADVCNFLVSFMYSPDNCRIVFLFWNGFKQFDGILGGEFYFCCVVVECFEV